LVAEPAGEPGAKPTHLPIDDVPCHVREGHTMRSRRLKTVVAAAAAATLITANLALADNLVADGDGLAPVASSEMDFGDEVCVGEASSLTALLAVSRQGSYGTPNVFAKGSEVVVSVVEASDHVTAVMETHTITVPGDWDAASNNTMTDPVAATVSILPSATGPFSGTVDFLATGTRDTGATLTRGTSLSVVGSAVDCSPDDVTAPEVTISLAPSTPDGDNDWYVSDVTVTVDATDEAGGSGLDEDTVEYKLNEGEWTAYTSPFVVSADGNHEVHARAKDNAGNDGTAGPVGLKIDQTDPVVTVTGVDEGETYTLGSVPSAGCSTSDLGSGVHTEATIAVLPDNSTVGTKTVQCTGARDNAGNTADSGVVTYKIVYDFDGFFRPVNNDGFNVVRPGQAVPLKFSLDGYHGLNVVSKVKAVTYSCSADPLEWEWTDSAPAGQSELTYDADADQYVYVWKTAKKWDYNCAVFAMEFNDGTSQHLKFQSR
jgi:hypothetical protein